MHVNRPCPICDADRAEPLAELEFGDFDGSSMDRTVRLVVCEQCGFVYNEGRFDQSTLNTFYESHSLYAAEMGVGSGGLSPWDQQRYADALALLERHLPSRDASILDVGCAKGGFLRTLEQHGYCNLRGVDLSPTCVKIVRERHGIEAAVGSTHHLPFEDLRPDAIVYSHVFEHLHDLRTAVEEAHHRLDDDGLLLVEIPDASRYAKYPVSDYYWLGQREHVNHLDAPHLESLMASSGFRAVEVDHPTMLISSTIENPLVRAVFRKDSPAPPSTSFDLRHSIQTYLNSQEASMSDRRHLVAELVASRRPCYVWAIGLEFFCLHTLANLRSCTIQCLIDNNPAKQCRTVDGLEILPQDRLGDASSDETVVLTSALHSDVLLKELETMSFEGDVLCLA